MDYKAIQELIKTVSESKLTSFEIEADGILIRMKKEQQVVAKDMLPVTREERMLCAEEETEELEQTNIKEKKKEENTKGILVIAPMVGTFFRAAAPEAVPFVQVGSKVKKGDPLCIIEAMKLMNEIQSEVEGEIVEVLVEEEAMVEYGQPLFRIQ